MSYKQTWYVPEEPVVIQSGRGRQDIHLEFESLSRRVLDAFERLNGDFLQVRNDVNSLPTFEEISNTPHGVIGGSKPKDVAMSGDYAFMLLHANPGYLLSYDVTDKHNPLFLHSVPINNGPNAIVIRGDYAYVGTNTGRLFIIDISTPEYLRVVSNTTFGGGGSQKFDIDVDSLGNYAYLADATGNGLYVIDTVDKESPVQVYNDSFSAGGVSLCDDFLFATDYSSASVRAYDVSDPTTPVFLSSFSVGVMPVNIHVDGNTVYVGEYANPQLYLVDASDPSSMSLLSTIDTGGALTNEGSSFVKPDGSVLYVFNRNAYISFYDISDKTNPQPTTLRFDFPSGAINGGFVSAGYIYVPDYGANSLSILTDIQQKLAVFGLTVGSVKLRTPSGATPKRPTAPVVGQQFFDTDIGVPIWYDGSSWVDSSGTVV